MGELGQTKYTPINAVYIRNPNAYTSMIGSDPDSNSRGRFLRWILVGNQCYAHNNSNNNNNRKRRRLGSGQESEFTKEEKRIKTSCLGELERANVNKTAHAKRYRTLWFYIYQIRIPHCLLLL